MVHFLLHYCPNRHFLRPVDPAVFVVVVWVVRFFLHVVVLMALVDQKAIVLLVPVDILWMSRMHLIRFDLSFLILSLIQIQMFPVSSEAVWYETRPNSLVYWLRA